MKKLSLLLITAFVSVIGYGQTTLNPYAYDLKSSWNSSTRQLTVSFMLNAKPNLDTSKGGAGIQIYAYDPSSPSTQYYICGPSGADINAKGVGPYSYTITFDESGKSDKTGVVVPLDTKLSWRVNVNGENQSSTNGRKVPTAVLDARSDGGNPPYKPHGVAVDNCTESPNFGQIYITEANTSTWSSTSTWYWMNSYTRPCIWMYKPNLTIEGNITKVLQDGSSTGVSNFSNPEPHRVRVSADGRVFVSSFHNSSSVAVWEYTGGNNFNRIIARNKDTDGRVVGMDVTGSGSSLKILLCYITDNTLTFKEFPIGSKSGLFTGTATSKGSFTGTSIPKDNNDALASVAYNDNGDTFWFAWDTELNANASQSGKSYVRQMVKNGTNYEPASWMMTMPDACGSGGLYVEGSLLVKATYNATGGGTLRFYNITSGGALQQKYSPISVRTSCWVNDIAADFAGNLYLTSGYTADALVVAMPYNGLTVTPAPSDYTFTIADPIPNILATDLRYTPSGNTDKYIFSFNVNTKPAVAQIRFYASYDAMKKSINVVHADNYDGVNTNKPSFVYDIPSKSLKQGRIEVEFAMCGGQLSGAVGSDGCKLLNDALPPGEWYWSVYVEAPRKSSSFAPMYRMKGVSTNTNTKDKYGNYIYNHERKYATVNNYPETDMFGSIIVAHNPSVVSNSTTRPERGIFIVGINPTGNSNDDQKSIINATRYQQTAQYLNGQLKSGMLNYPRRMTVAPDGKVYIADEGNETAASYSGAKDVVMHLNGGIKLWDPADPFRFKLFSDNKIGTSTGVAYWNNKLYAMNTYNEYLLHIMSDDLQTAVDESNYTKEQQEDPNKFGWNGFVQYDKVDEFYTTSNDGTWANFWSKNSRAQERALRRGDASGNSSIVAMDKGVWICQHREHTVAIKEALHEPYADNIEALTLSFVPYGSSTRTWQSSTTLGIYWKNGVATHYEKSPWTQLRTSPMQSTPGGGMTYKALKDKNGNILKEYVYVVNHEGNIVVFQITGWATVAAGAQPILSHIMTLVTPADTKATQMATKTGFTSQPWHTACITSMEFDYAGNLITTTGTGNHNTPQDLLLYTMPYDRVNAQEIQAPNSCRYIPERISQTYNKHHIVIDPYVVSGKSCGLDVYRPMMKGSFNTICLPFSMTAEQIAQSPYAGATIMRYAGASYRTQDGEGMVDFNFEPVTAITAGEPYLIQLPETSAIRGIVRFEPDVAVKLSTNQPANKPMQAIAGTDAPQNSQATYQGIIDMKTWSADDIDLFPIFLLTDNNRLGEVRTYGDMYGLRGYFRTTNIPTSAKYNISSRKPATTGLVDHKGRPVDVEKFVREGRAYIRVGETLYTLDGQKVGR